MLKILIADDHAVVRKGLRLILLEEYPSAQVGEVPDVGSLIQEVLSSDWDIVICDMNMPGRSGLDGLSQIRQAKPDLPVLIMSMYPEDQYALRVLKAGASGYLSKETVHDDIIKAVQAIQRGRRYITPTIAEKLADAVGQKSDKASHELLSDREFDVFKLLAAGQSVSEIADQLSLSSTTVSTYRSRVMEKMQLKSNSDLTRYAIENNLI